MTVIRRTGFTRWTILFLALESIAMGDASWRSDRSQFESIGLDGNLERSFELGYIGNPQISDFCITLEHEVELNARGGPASRWSVPQLSSFLVDAEGGGWKWKAPGRFEVNFDKDGKMLPGGHPPPGAGWHATLDLPGTITIRDQEGTSYTYTAGAWKQFAFLGDLYTVESKGGLVLSIRPARRTGANLESMYASYDADGELCELQLGGAIDRFKYDGSVPSLQEWIASNSGSVRTMIFAYRNNLLASIRGGGIHENYQWTQVIEPNERRISNYILPVVLAGDSNFVYRYWIDSSGIQIWAQRRSDRMQEHLLFNPFWHRTVEVDFNGKLTVTPGG